MKNIPQEQPLAPVKTRYRGIVGVACGVLLAIAIAQSSGEKDLLGRLIIADENSYPILAKCSGKEEKQLYEIFGSAIQSPFPDTIDIWSQQYRQQVSSIIEEYIQEERSINCLENFIDHLPGTASSQLRSLASKLPPWKESEDLAMLSRIDTGIVLLELLRTYECALTERYVFLFTDSASDLFTIQGDDVWWTQIFKEYGKQKRKILKELTIARPALNRTLAIANKSGGLRLLRRDIECVKRSSIDIRNGFALGAESAACMPRIQDSKAPFRDIE